MYQLSFTFDKSQVHENFLIKPNIFKGIYCIVFIIKFLILYDEKGSEWNYLELT